MLNGTYATPSALALRLCKKIENELNIKCDPRTFHRTYAGARQRDHGAWSWMVYLKDGSAKSIGCSAPATECVREEWSLGLDNKDGRSIFLRKKELNICDTNPFGDPRIGG